MAKAKAYKTAIFEIHNPSKRKQLALLDAFKRYHLAYDHGLRKLRAESARIRAEIEDLGLTKQSYFIQNEVTCLIKKQPLASGAKAGVKNDLADQLLAHFALLDKFEKEQKAQKSKPEEKRKKLSKPSTPSVQLLKSDPDDYATLLDKFASAIELEAEDRAKADILREAKTGCFRPILFLKNRVQDGFLLLHNPAKDRFYVYLNLFAEHNRFAPKKVDFEGLVNVRQDKVGYPMAIGAKTSKTGLLFPVNFAKDYHFAEFMQKGRPQSAKLVHHKIEGKDRFEVHVTFEFEAEKIDTVCWLGVDRGIHNLASLCVIDSVGRILAQENFDGGHLRDVQIKEEKRHRTAQKKSRRYRSSTRRTEAAKAVHSAANAIIKVALTHKAQIVMENLDNMTKRNFKRKRSNFNRLLNRSQYSKLQLVLDYKLKCVGLPKPTRVAASFTSQTCPECGHCEKDNRKKEVDLSQFRCLSCDYQSDADLNAARVIALKKLWRERLPEIQKKQMFKDLQSTQYSFESFLKKLARQRCQDT